MITPGRCSKLSLEVIKHRLSTSNLACFIKTIKSSVVEMISNRYSWSNLRQLLWHSPPLIKRQSSSGVTIVLIPSKMRTKLKSIILLLIKETGTLLTISVAKNVHSTMKESHQLLLWLTTHSKILELCLIHSRLLWYCNQIHPSTNKNLKSQSKKPINTSIRFLKPQQHPLSLTWQNHFKHPTKTPWQNLSLLEQTFQTRNKRQTKW